VEVRRNFLGPGFLPGGLTSSSIILLFVQSGLNSPPERFGGVVNCPLFLFSFSQIQTFLPRGSISSSIIIFSIWSRFESFPFGQGSNVKINHSFDKKTLELPKILHSCECTWHMHTIFGTQIPCPSGVGAALNDLVPGLHGAHPIVGSP